MDHGYSIYELIDKASDCLKSHFKVYDHIGLLVGPGNNGADALSLGIKLSNMEKMSNFIMLVIIISFHQGISSILICVRIIIFLLYSSVKVRWLLFRKVFKILKSSEMVFLALV